MGRKDIHKDAVPFTKNDPRINRDGRPPKLLTQLNAELKQKGYEPVSESQVIEAYLTLLNMDKNAILEYVKSGDVPAIFEIAAKGIGGKQGLQAVEKLLERALGKPKEKHQHEHQITEFRVEIVNQKDEG